MRGNIVDPLTETHEPQDVAYGKSYLEWKGWQEDNFAQLRSLQDCYFKAELGRTKHNFNDKTKVLEIGFGNGTFLAYAKHRGWEATGTEVNNALVETANRLGFNAIPAVALDTLEDGSFDLVVAFDVLEHIPPDQMLDFVRHLAAKLRAGGFLLARFPNADSPFGLVNQNGDSTHRNAIGTGKVRYLARELGLKLVFYGGEAIPVCGGVTRSIRRFCGLAVFKAIDALVNNIFFPNGHIAFCSGNAVMILQSIDCSTTPTAL